MPAKVKNIVFKQKNKNRGVSLSSDIELVTTKEDLLEFHTFGTKTLVIDSYKEYEEFIPTVNGDMIVRNNEQRTDLLSFILSSGLVPVIEISTRFTSIIDHKNGRHMVINNEGFAIVRNVKRNNVLVSNNEKLVEIFNNILLNYEVSFNVEIMIAREQESR